ncbi:hypothetical protein Taro_037202 [Colocasia esculenta]|uniref:Importin N-terminal domain-containing protein n=1 Tax=Colocasia esculenta TaxID=4460 RepID=A0A843WNZ1_COLES|nr:hypothetical protein [Colocasia esculenta]
MRRGKTYLDSHKAPPPPETPLRAQTEAAAAGSDDAISRRSEVFGAGRESGDRWRLRKCAGKWWLDTEGPTLLKIKRRGGLNEINCSNISRHHCFDVLLFNHNAHEVCRSHHLHLRKARVSGEEGGDRAGREMEAELLVTEIARLLEDTLSPEEGVISSATEGLDRLSSASGFAHALLAIATGGGSGGGRIAAATYLKNFTKRWLGSESLAPEARCEFRNQLVQALLRADFAVLRILVEAFRFIVIKDFVEGNTWPELVPELKLVIQNSDLTAERGSQWKTINAVAVLQTIIKPFQYFQNPKLVKEPVPPQLELIAEEILVPLQISFSHFVDKVLSFQGGIERETEQIILIICKCMYYAVRSYLPSALSTILPSFCRALFRILDSLDLSSIDSGDGNLPRLKTGKRSLIIFSTLVTRHRKHFDKLMPDIINSSFTIARHSANISKMDSLSERIVSLALDVISHVLETGPGWRFVSPHFSTVLESAVFPALVLNEKDISEWEEDQEEYIRKNHPSDVEISGWSEDLFTARKSAINLLGVIALSKGPPTVFAGNASAASVKRKKGDKNKRKDKRSSIGELLVIPFLSKFPFPSDAQGTQSSYDYYGVLMAYGGLQDFLRERNPDYTTNLIRNRVLPLYSLHSCLPYLIATANWIIGELAACLPQELCKDVYGSLMKALVMADEESCSCYPVHASAAGAIAQLLENDYLPPDWLSLVEVIAKQMGYGDENEISLLFQLISTVVEVGQQDLTVHIPTIVSSITNIMSKYLPPVPEPWPQVVEHGFATLAEIAQTQEDRILGDDNQNRSKEVQLGQASIARSFSNFLQKAWFSPLQIKGGEDSRTSHPLSCIDDASVLVGHILQFIDGVDEVIEMKIAELLVVWADLIAEYDAWEEMEDLKIFSPIRKAVLLHKKYDNDNFFMRRMPLQDLPAGPQRSIIEGIGAFVCHAVSGYPSAAQRACICIHLLLHMPRFSFENENIKQALAISFTQPAFSHFRNVQNKASSLWKPLLLGISSCYLCYPDIIEGVLQEIEQNGYTVWACGLAHISNSSFEQGLASESEIKLAVMALIKVVERLLRSNLDMCMGVLRDCFISLMEASVRLKEVQEEEDEDEEDEEEDDDEDNDDSSEEIDEDTEDEEREETEEEFLDRYAKAASALDTEILEEVDEEGLELGEELELGALGEVDVQAAVFSLVQRHHQVLLQGQLLPSQLIPGILSTFPEYGLYFQSSS